MNDDFMMPDSFERTIKNWACHNATGAWIDKNREELYTAGQKLQKEAQAEVERWRLLEIHRELIEEATVLVVHAMGKWYKESGE